MAAMKTITRRAKQEVTVASLFEVWQDRHAATLAAGGDDDLYAANRECEAITLLIDCPARNAMDLAAKIAAATVMGADPTLLSGDWGEKIAAEAVRLLMAG